MEMCQIKETVLQDNTYPKYLEKVMGGRHRWGHLYSRFQGIFSRARRDAWVWSIRMKKSAKKMCG